MDSTKRNEFGRSCNVGIADSHDIFRFKMSGGFDMVKCTENSKSFDVLIA